LSAEAERRLRNLNPAQEIAVDSIVEGWDSDTGEFHLPIVEGPPGTGKTYIGTLATYRYWNENSNPEIAYLCYTHYASDRALEGLIELGFSPNEVIRIVDRSQRIRYQNSPFSDYYIAFNTVNDLRPNDRRRLRNTPILISTILGASKVFQYQRQPEIIIDEFSQVPPTLFFSTVSKVRASSRHNPSGYSLLGDPNQLPYITTQPLLRPNIGLYIMARKYYQPHELNIQYRMHPNICQTVNALREGINAYELISDPATTHNKTLSTMGYHWSIENCPTHFYEIIRPENTCVIINTDQLPGIDETGPGGSKYYTSEAHLAARLAQAINQSYVNDGGKYLEPIILTPYTAQIGVIRGYLPDHLQYNCTSIHQSQGREYPCVIVSFTRKNVEGSIGFLGQTHLKAQTYVACSRAEAKLILLLSYSTFYGRGHGDFDLLIDRSTNATFIDAERTWVD